MTTGVHPVTFAVRNNRREVWGAPQDYGHRAIARALNSLPDGGQILVWRSDSSRVILEKDNGEIHEAAVPY